MNCKRCAQFPLFFVVCVLLIVFFLHLDGLCATSAPARTNAFEAYISDDNPFIYMYGSLVNGAMVGKDANLTFQPAYTFGLHTEQVLICGDSLPEDGIASHTPIVMTYERVSHRANHDIGCHKLVAVDVFNEEKKLK